MKNERRQFPRFSLEQMIELGFNRERYIDAEGINASQNGILCRTEEPFENNAKVFMMLSVPGENTIETVQCEGVVVRSDRKGDYWETGINITDISEEGRAFFSEYLKRTGE